MRFIDRRTLLSGLSASVASSALPALGQTRRPYVSPTEQGTGAGAQRAIVNAVATQRAVVALTFDDGPHPRHTPRLLDVLAMYRQRATFYVIGANARRYPEIIARMVAEGHEIANHTWTHPVLTQLGDARILSELDRTQDQIGALTGYAPVSLRPPYGAISPRQSRMIRDARGLSCVLWSVDPEDWRRPGAAVVAERIVRRAQPGGIILAHDIHGATVDAVPRILDGLHARGLVSVQLSDLMDGRRWGPSATAGFGRSRARI